MSIRERIALLFTRAWGLRLADCNLTGGDRFSFEEARTLLLPGIYTARMVVEYLFAVTNDPRRSSGSISTHRSELSRKVKLRTFIHNPVGNGGNVRGRLKKRTRFIVILFNHCNFV